MSRQADPEALIRYVIASLVDHPDSVNIATRESDSSVTFEIALHPDDIGKVIGRQGRIIKALRTLARASAGQTQGHVDVEVVG
ncbi:MAG TPA: KH domain-containing protein [Coriobacteriia bacterium]|nr:KH domain-containing protein [Coriobacteriia bacterium]